MAQILRGDVFWANLNPTIGNEQAGRRPVLVLSQDIFNSASGTVIAMAITSKRPKAGFPLTLALDSSDFPKKSWLKISQVRTLSTKRLGKRIGRVLKNELEQALEGLNELIGY